MKKVWHEFKSFAMSGNVFDLALGFLIGAAFSTLIQSLADNVLMQLIGAIFGQPDFTAWAIPINGTKVKYGAFLTDLLSFFMLAGVLFLIVKLMSATGIARRRVFDERECPYCMEPVDHHALVCKTCCSQLVSELPSVEEAQKRWSDLRAPHAIRVPPIQIPKAIPRVPVPARFTRKRSASNAGGTSDEAG